MLSTTVVYILVLSTPEAQVAALSEKVVEYLAGRYGQAWDEDPRNADAVRCVQWGIKEAVSPDSNMQNANSDVVGRWGCMSSLLREAIAGSLGTFDMKQAPESKAQYSGSGWLKRIWTPKVCSLLAKKTTTCQVQVYGEKDFKPLLALEFTPNGLGPSVLEALSNSLESGPIVSFSAGAGKSGSGFARTWDSVFKVKVGIRNDFRMNEPNNLKQLLQGTDKATTLRQHLKEHPNSLLNRYYALVKIKIQSVDVFALVMQDASYLSDTEAQWMSGMTFLRYDLKGKSRPQDKKQDADKQFTLLNGDFQEREGNRMKLYKEQCDSFVSAIKADVGFLNSHSMIDYSLFVCVATADRDRLQPLDHLSCVSNPGGPFCMRAGHRVYTVSIIDYLNDFNAWKKAEMKFSGYDEQISDFATAICPGEDPSSFETPLRRGLKYLFLCVFLLAVLGVLLLIGWMLFVRKKWLDTPLVYLRGNTRTGGTELMNQARANSHIPCAPLQGVAPPPLPGAPGPVPQNPRRLGSFSDHTPWGGVRYPYLSG